MAVEIANALQAMVVIRGNAALPPQLLAGAGVIAASLVRTAAGTYTIDLEQPLTLALPAQPAPGFTDFALTGNAQNASDLVVNASIIQGAVPGRFDRLRINVLLAGVLADTTDIPLSVVVFRFPNVA